MCHRGDGIVAAGGEEGRRGDDEADDDEDGEEDEWEESFRSLLIRSGVILYGNQDKTALVSLFATPDQEPLAN